MKHVFLIIDGLSETKSIITSLEKSNTPVIDLLFNQSNCYGFYMPEKALFHSEPKTDVIVPSFFNLLNKHNPGRAALELIDLNICLICNTVCMGINAPNSINLYSSTFMSGLKRIAGQDAVVIESNAINDGKKILLGNIVIHRVSELYEFIGDYFQNSNEINITDVGFVNESFFGSYNSQNRAVFLGWAKGALRGAFKHLGFQCNTFQRLKDEYFNWESYQSDFEHWVIPYVQENKESKDLFVLYTKESAFATRQKNGAEKVKAIEMMDSFLGRLLKIFQEPLRVIILSDHSSDFGESGNPVKNTVFLICDYQPGSASEDKSHFSEHNPLVSSPKLISQSQLIELIKSNSNFNRL